MSVRLSMFLPTKRPMFSHWLKLLKLCSGNRILLELSQGLSVPDLAVRPLAVPYSRARRGGQAAAELIMEFGDGLRYELAKTSRTVRVAPGDPKATRPRFIMWKLGALDLPRRVFHAEQNPG